MDPGLAVVVLSVLMFLAVLFGVVSQIFIRPFESQKEEAERIFRQRVISDDEGKIKLELAIFFHKTKRLIFCSSVGFMSAFVLSVMIAKRLYPSGSLRYTLVSLAVLLLIFGLTPMTGLILANNQVNYLRKNIMDRFNKSD